MTTISGYRLSSAVLADVMENAGISDATALVGAAAGFDDGNGYLKRSELEAGAAALAPEPSAPAGYRFSAAVLEDVMQAYGLTDRDGLLAAAAQLDDGNGYLKRSELEAAAESLDVPLQGYRWSASVLAQVMSKNGLADEQALLREAVALDDGNRYLKRSELEAAAKLFSSSPALVGIISDLDKTIIPAHSGDLPDTAIPGVAQLFHELELRDDDDKDDTFYVTARSPDRVVDVPEYLERHGLPAGPINTGVGTQPWIAQAEKVRDVGEVLAARPEHRFFLFGDTSHRDPDVYQDVIAAHPDRVVAAFVMKVNNISDARAEGLHVIENYAQAAAILLSLGELDEAASRRVMVAAQMGGLDITDEAIDALVEANRP